MRKKVTPWLLSAFSAMQILASVSCNKDKQPDPSLPNVPEPQLEYFDLGNRIVPSNAPAFTIDVNHDGRRDLAFSTLLVGDPIYHVDKVQFLVSSNIQINLPVDVNEQIPVMNLGDPIVIDDFNGYRWFELSTIVLTQKIISVNQPPIWEGNWTSALHKYLPFQVQVNSQRYNGWVELSADIVNERIVLHKGAICKEAGKIIKAGK
jgi:hypothetical protein